LHYTSLRIPLKEYALSCDLRLGQLYDHVNRYRHFTLRLVLMSMLISTNMASTGPTERTEDIDKAEDEALTHINEIVTGIHTVKDIVGSTLVATKSHMLFLCIVWHVCRTVE
jgi:hypothetical protein